MTTTTDDKARTYFHRIAAGAALAWTVTLVCSASWNVHNERLQTLALVNKEAISHFNKDQAFRLWGTKHGGVYVPPSEQTPPNPYLSHIPDRDLTLPSGKRLTLMNPAYMVRQMMADYDELYGIKGRITSLQPLNPLNAPDTWERKALQAFEKGAKEQTAIIEQDGQQSLRLMRPMVAQAGCLKCHGHQGYKEGDIRGGVGVSVPLAPYLALQKKVVKATLLSHLVIWLLGLTVLGRVFFWGKRFILEQRKADAALRESDRRFRRFFEQAPLPLCYVDKEGVLVHVNDRFIQVFGYTHDDVPTLKEWWQLAYPEEDYRKWVLTTWEAAVAKAARDGTDIEPVEYQVTCKNGAKRDVLIGGITLEDSFLATFIDRTERKWAEEENRRRAQELAALLKSSQRLASSLDLKNVLQTFINETVEVTGLGTGAIYLLEGEELYLWATTPPLSEHFPEELRRAPIADHPHIKQAVSTRGPVLIADMDVADLTPAEKAVSEMRGLRSLLYVPLVGRGKVTGVFIVGSVAEPCVISEEMINMSCTMANNAVLAIDNAHLYEAAREHANTLENKVRERTAELETKVAEIERMNKLFVGRELRMRELKERIAKLERENPGAVKA